MFYQIRNTVSTNPDCSQPKGSASLSEDGVSSSEDSDSPSKDNVSPSEDNVSPSEDEPLSSPYQNSKPIGTVYTYVIV